MHIRKVLFSRWFCLIAITALLLVYTFTVSIFKVIQWSQDIDMKIPSCYRFPNLSYDKSVGILDDILNANLKIERGRSIFFLLTSCAENNVIALNQRQTCAIESAALHNPNRSIFVLFASPVGLSSESLFVGALQSYANIHFLNINLKTIVLGTPVEGFFQSGVLFDSSYLVEHMSDLLRLTVLYKYGGIYFDTDVVVLKNMDGMPANFLGKEAVTKEEIHNVNNAVLGFQDETGHEILDLCLRELTNSYSSDSWNYNGGLLLTRVLEQQVCNASLLEMTPEKCHGFKVFPREEFYAINWKDWEQLFNASDTETVLETIKRSSVAHLWNKMSHNKIITKSNAKTAYGILAEQNCPKAFKASGAYF